MSNEMINDLRGRLQNLDVHEVRKLCRHFGIVLHSANQKKGELIDELISIASGGEIPQKRSNKGAKPKSSGYNEVLAEDIDACRAAALGIAMAAPSAELLGVERGTVKKEGFFDGVGVRIGGITCAPTPIDALKMRYDLRVGDLVELGTSGGDAFEILKINGESPTKFRKRFEDFVRVYPDTRVRLQGDLTCRLINLFAPLALGQRAFIVGGRNSGKSTALKSVLSGVNDNSIVKMALLVGVAPEEVTDFRRSGCGEVYFTTFEMSLREHIEAVRVIGEHARRLAELGKNVILAVDGFETLTRTQSQAASDAIRRLLFTACNDENGGSVTIITAAESGSAGEVSHLADNCVSLSEGLAARRVFPAIDIRNSFSDRKEGFLTEGECIAEQKLCKMASERGNEAVISLFKTSGDEELFESLKD